MSFETVDETAGSPWPRERPMPRAADGWRYRRFGRIDPDDVILLVWQSALDDARNWSRTDMHREVGGILVGGYYVDRTRAKPLHYVEVVGFVPAPHGRSSAGQFMFTHDTFSACRKTKEARFGDDYLELGWHHTHPGISLFLSRADVFIHESFYPEPWMPALVMDPQADELEFFRMRQGRVEKWGCCVLTREGAPQDYDSGLRFLS